MRSRLRRCSAVRLLRAARRSPGSAEPQITATAATSCRRAEMPNSPWTSGRSLVPEAVASMSRPYVEPRRAASSNRHEPHCGITPRRSGSAAAVGPPSVARLNRTRRSITSPGIGNGLHFTVVRTARSSGEPARGRRYGQLSANRRARACPQRLSNWPRDARCGRPVRPHGGQARGAVDPARHGGEGGRDRVAVRVAGAVRGCGRAGRVRQDDVACVVGGG